MICPGCFAPTTGGSATCEACAGSGSAVVTASGDPIDPVARRELADAFSLERLIQGSASSACYAARENGSGRLVAVRSVPKRLVRDAGLESHFARAAVTATSLAHPHIVPMLSFGTTAHFVWYAVEYAEGRPLSAVLAQDGPFEPRRCLWIVQQIAGAVQYAHGRGVVHGDLRPECVWLDAREWARVGDFAVGAVLGEMGSGAPDDEARRLFYRAPEAAQERRLGPAADQYALAVLVAECLGGVTREATARNEDAAPLSVQIPESTPTEIRDALKRAMSERPADRFRSMLEFVGILETADVDTKRVVKPVRNPAQGPSSGSTPRVIRVDRPFSNPRARMTAHAVSIAGVVAAVAYLGFRPNAPPPAPGPLTGAVAAVPPPAAARPPAPATRTVTEPPPAVVEAPRPRADTSPRPRSEEVKARSAPPRTTPSPVRAQRTVPQRQPTPPPVVVPTGPGFISVNSTPWGRVYIDGLFIGHTPISHAEVAPGHRLLRILRDGFEPYERVVAITPGQDLKVVGIILKESTP